MYSILIIFFALWVVVFLSLRLRGKLETFDLWFSFSVWLLFFLAAWGKTFWFHLIVLSLVSVWSISLIALVFLRTVSLGDDFRYQEIKNLPKATVFQIIASALTASPSICLQYEVELVWYRAIFLLLAFVFLCLKLWCDFFLLWHRLNRSGLLTTNFWKIVRYPNYLFEILFWTSIALSNFNANYWWIGLLSPIFIAITLTFFSGIPLLEKRLLERYGSTFLEYTSKTPKLVPLNLFKVKCLFQKNQ